MIAVTRIITDFRFKHRIRFVTLKLKPKWVVDDFYMWLLFERIVLNQAYDGTLTKQPRLHFST